MKMEKARRLSYAPIACAAILCAVLPNICSVPLPPCAGRSDSGCSTVARSAKDPTHWNGLVRRALHQFGRQMAHAGL